MEKVTVERFVISNDRNVIKREFPHQLWSLWGFSGILGLFVFHLAMCVLSNNDICYTFLDCWFFHTNPYYNQAWVP